MAQDSAVQADEPRHIKKHYKKLKHMKSLEHKGNLFFSFVGELGEGAVPMAC